jgi:hypothetical protein
MDQGRIKIHYDVVSNYGAVRSRYCPSLKIITKVTRNSIKKSASTPVRPDRQMFPGEKKGGFPLLFAKDYLTPRGWGAGAGFFSYEKTI